MLVQQEKALATAAVLVQTGKVEARVAGVDQMWGMLERLDALQIELRAAEWLATVLDRAALEGEFPEAEVRRERALMRAFYATVLDYWVDRSPEVYPAVEHEVDDWLDGHAEILAEVRWQQIEPLLTQAGDPSGRDVLQRCLTREQRTARMEIEQRALWAIIALRVEVALGFVEVVA